MSKDSTLPRPSGWNVYFNVHDVKDLIPKSQQDFFLKAASGLWRRSAISHHPLNSVTTH